MSSTLLFLFVCLDSAVNPKPLAGPQGSMVSVCSRVPWGPQVAPSDLPSSTWSAFGHRLRAKCLVAAPRAACPISLRFGGMDSEPATYNGESWPQDAGWKGIGATASNPISRTSREGRVEPSAYPLSPSPLPTWPARCGPPRRGSLAACHDCIMAGGCGRSPVPARLGSQELTCREPARADHQRHQPLS